MSFPMLWGCAQAMLDPVPDPPVTVSVTPSSYSNSNHPVADPLDVQFTATPGGGPAEGSYTYSWSLVNVTGSAGVSILSGQTSNVCTLRFTEATADIVISGTLRCTVTKSTANGQGDATFSVSYDDSTSSFSLSWMNSAYNFSGYWFEEDCKNYLHFKQDGTVWWEKQDDDFFYSNTEIGKWADPGTATIGNDYRIKVTVTGDTARYVGMTSGSWYQLSLTRSCGLLYWAAGNFTINVSVEITENASPYTSVATKSFTMNLTLT